MLLAVLVVIDRDDGGDVGAGEELLRERSEGVRVAYVASTRAKDLLVVPAVGEGPFEGWVAPLNSALYPSHSDWRKNEDAVGCPSFKGDATVLDRPLIR